MLIVYPYCSPKISWGPNIGGEYYYTTNYKLIIVASALGRFHLPLPTRLLVPSARQSAFFFLLLSLLIFHTSIKAQINGAAGSCSKPTRRASHHAYPPRRVRACSEDLFWAFPYSRMHSHPIWETLGRALCVWRRAGHGGQPYIMIWPMLSTTDLSFCTGLPRTSATKKKTEKAA